MMEMDAGVVMDVMGWMDGGTAARLHGIKSCRLKEKQ